MTIAEKYAAQYQPNGEVSLADLIQAAIDEDRRDIAVHLECMNQRIRQLEAQSVAVVGEATAQPHQLRQVDVRIGNNSAGWIGCHDDTVRIPAAELDALRKCKDLLAEARDDVNSVLNDLLVLGNYPHNKRRLRIQQELLANIDAAIAQEKGE